MKVAHRATADTYLPRSLQPSEEQPRQVDMYVIVREADARKCTGRPDEEDDDADKEVRRPELLSGVYRFAMMDCLRATLPTSHQALLAAASTTSSSPSFRTNSNAAFLLADYF